MKIKSEKYELEITEDGTVTVHRSKPVELSLTVGNEAGVKKQVLGSAEVELGKWLSKAPVFIANYAGKGSYNVDAEAGFQRFHGHLSAKDFSAGLKRCGFNAVDVTKLLRKHKHTSVQRYG